MTITPSYAHVRYLPEIRSLSNSQGSPAIQMVDRCLEVALSPSTIFCSMLLLVKRRVCLILNGSAAPCIASRLK